MPIQLDIHTGVITAVIIAVILGILSLVAGVRGVFISRKLLFYRMRRDRIVQGWRRVFFSLVFFASAYLLYTYAEPAAYRFYPPSPTPTITPSITTSPTISLTPTISETPTITPTPEIEHSDDNPDTKLTPRYRGTV